MTRPSAEPSSPGRGSATRWRWLAGEDDTMYVLNRSYDYRPDGKRITICTIDEDYVGEFARGVTTQGDGEPT